MIPLTLPDKMDRMELEFKLKNVNLWFSLFLLETIFALFCFIDESQKYQ